MHLSNVRYRLLIISTYQTTKPSIVKLEQSTSDSVKMLLSMFFRLELVSIPILNRICDDLSGCYRALTYFVDAV